MIISSTRPPAFEAPCSSTINAGGCLAQYKSFINFHYSSQLCFAFFSYSIRYCTLRLSFSFINHTKLSASYSTMKLYVAKAAAVCLVLLLASEMVLTSQAAGCSIYQLAPCIAASKNAKVMPSQQCCTNVAQLGQGLSGANCLCSLLSNSLAKSQGVVPRIALGIPQKCRLPVPKGFVCQGIRVPGS